MANLKLATTEYVDTTTAQLQDFFADVNEDATTGNLELDLKDAEGNTVGQIIIQKTGGIIITNIAAPTQDDYVANKKYVDDIVTALSNTYATKTDLSGKLDKVTGTSPLRRVYVINADGTQGTNSISSDTENSSIAVRTATGTLRVQTPTNESDAATKKYVDDIVGDIESILATAFNDVSTQNEDEEVTA